MISLKAVIATILPRQAFGSAEELQHEAMLDSMQYFRVAQARRIGRGQGPRGPQKKNKDSTRRAKIAAGYPDIPLVREKVLSDPRKWRIDETRQRIALVPPTNRILIVKYLKRLGYTFGMSRRERDNIRAKNWQWMSRWKLSDNAAEKRI